MVEEGFDWQLFLSAAGTVIALIGVFGGVWTYKVQKNREYNERSLNEVYTPLYSLIVKQEKLRELFFPHITVKEAPIITTKKEITKQKFDINSGKIKFEQIEQKGYLDREDFIKSLDDTNKGLASPELLRLIAEYEVLVYLEDTLSQDSEEWEKATQEKVDVEYQLAKEIVRGYSETRKKLKLGKINEIKKFNL